MSGSYAEDYAERHRAKRNALFDALSAGRMIEALNDPALCGAVVAWAKSGDERARAALQNKRVIAAIRNRPKLRWMLDGL